MTLKEFYFSPLRFREDTSLNVFRLPDSDEALYWFSRKPDLKPITPKLNGNVPLSLVEILYL